MRLTKLRVVYLVLGVATVFLVGGGLDFVGGLFYGGRWMLHPTLSAFSPVACMLYALAFVGTALLIHGGQILTENVELAKKQVEGGLAIIFFTVPVLMELLYRVTLNL